MVIAYVGSGGKTTLIHRRAQSLRSQGLKVFVTTTTHMFIEQDTLLQDDAAAIIRALHERGYAMAGIPEGEKIAALSPAVYREVCRQADVVLVEADGSRRMPVKFPGPGEPVIPENADEIIVVCGLQALGKTIGAAAHRPELVMRCLGADMNTILTPEHIRRLMLQGYLQPLRQRYPGKAIRIQLTHDASEAQRRIAAELEDELNACANP